MAGINDNAIIDRIIENLSHKPNDVYGNSASLPKLDKIIFGDPPVDNKNAEGGNVAYVKCGEKTLVSSTRLGASSGRKVSNETREYWIVIINGSTSVIEQSIRNLNTLTFKIKEILQLNRHLGKPDFSDPMANDVTVFDVPRDVSKIGLDRQSNTIIVRYDFTVS